MASASAIRVDVGPECSKHGITLSMLLAVATSSATASLPELDVVTNQLVLELATVKDKHYQCTFYIFRQWLRKLFGRRWPEQAPTPQAITRSVKRLLERLHKMKKQPTSSNERGNNLADLLQQEFTLPVVGICKGVVVHFSPVKKLHEVSKETQELRQKMYSITRNTNKRLKRREATIAKQQACIDIQHEKIEMYEKKLQGTEGQLSKLRANLNRVNHRAAYWRARVDDFKGKKSAKEAKLLQEVKLLKEEILVLDSSNAELSETIESILSSDEIATFEGGKYTDDIRACIYELLSLNVGVRNVKPIVCCVLKNLAHKSVARLPSHGLTCQMLLESLTIAQAQLGEKLSQSLDYNTLQTDGTTKFGDHFETYDVKTAEDKPAYTLGLRHVFSGSAANTLDTFKEILDDIDSVQQAIGKDAVSAKVVSKIKNTMSDRHSAEKLFNELLHDYRAELLPTVAENWKQMTEAERDNFTRMNNFFSLCGWIS